MNSISKNRKKHEKHSPESQGDNTGTKKKPKVEQNVQKNLTPITEKEVRHANDCVCVAHILPLELWVYVFSFLPMTNIFKRAVHVCTVFRQAAYAYPLGYQFFVLFDNGLAPYAFKLLENLKNEKKLDSESKSTLLGEKVREKEMELESCSKIYSHSPIVIAQGYEELTRNALKVIWDDTQETPEKRGHVTCGPNLKLMMRNQSDTISKNKNLLSAHFTSTVYCLLNESNSESPEDNMVVDALILNYAIYLLKDPFFQQEATPPVKLVKRALIDALDVNQTNVGRLNMIRAIENCPQLVLDIFSILAKSDVDSIFIVALIACHGAFSEKTDPQAHFSSDVIESSKSFVSENSKNTNGSMVKNSISELASEELKERMKSYFIVAGLEEWLGESTSQLATLSYDYDAFNLSDTE